MNKNFRITIIVTLVLISIIALWLVNNSDTQDSSKIINSKVHEHSSTDEHSQVSWKGIVELDAIPIGDGNVSNSPKVGSTYACNTNFRAGGAVHVGDWVDQASGTWNYLNKIKVTGSVDWLDAEYSELIKGEIRVLISNGLPNDYATGVYPIRRSDPAYRFDTNPNSIGIQDLLYEIPRNPVLASQASCTPLGPIGVMSDGVVLFNSLDDAGLDAVANEVQDSCDGHPSGNKTYHYHNVSSCTVVKSEGESTLVGYALDGFGIYVERDDSGNLPTNVDLDVCHGRKSEIMWDGNLIEMYHYSATLEYPYTVGCFMGVPVVGAGSR